MLVVGDIQGCLDPLRRLVALVPADERLVFVGDIVNRGPQSLAALRYVRGLGARAVVLLGNHDLHLLAVDAGVEPQKTGDTLGEILAAPDRAELIGWLRRQPLAHTEAGALFVHAGTLPPWSVAQTLALAGEVQARLQRDDYRQFLGRMYGNRPARWDEALVGDDRLRCIVNALTRLRFVAADGTMDLKIKQGPAAAPPGFVPWFDHPARATRGTPILFGHWSTLGFMERADAICLDSGCVWGGRLSGLRWPQRQHLSVACAAE